MNRHALKDEQWSRIADCFPEPAATGRPPWPNRVMFEAMLWVMKTGSPWRDLPAEMPPGKTVWHRFNAWNREGILGRVLQRIHEQIEPDPELWCIDGTHVRISPAAAGGGKKGIPRNRRIMRSARAAAEKPAKSS